MEEISSLKNSIWKHFKRTRENLGKCNYCSKVFNAPNLPNLKKHLLNTHADIDLSATNDISVEESDEDSEKYENSDAEGEENIQSVPESGQARAKKKSKYGKHKAWNYFEDRNNVNKTAKCKLCFNTMSYKSTTGNLRMHLIKMHGIDVHDLNHQALAPTLTTENIDINFKFEDEDSADAATFKEDDVIIANPLEEGQVSSEVMQFFQETSSKTIYKCILCNKPIHNSNKQLLNHLSDDHPDLVVIDETGGDGFDEPESPLFKEFIKIKSTQKKRKFSTPSTQQNSKKELDFSVPAKKIKIDETKHELSEIDCFLQYIGVLLKDFSKDNFSELQLEIIKLIMTKKIQCQRNDVNINQSSEANDQSRGELLHPSSSTNQRQ